MQSLSSLLEPSLPFHRDDLAFTASTHLFHPAHDSVVPYHDATPAQSRVLANNLNREITDFVNQRDYPCVAAKTAIKKKDYRIGVYGDLGSGRFARDLAQDLLYFKQEYSGSKSSFLSFIATFEGTAFATELEFENALWRELSFVASVPESVPEYRASWDPNFSSDPDDENFCFSFGGDAFFVVGLHPGSSRKARRFATPTLIFNLYAQFEQLDEETEFYPMVRTNRKKDIAFQGSVNPMVEKYAEKWEAIQFSGKENPPEWKCPFKRMMSRFGLSAALTK